MKTSLLLGALGIASVLSIGVLVFEIGFFPNLFLDRMKDSVNLVANHLRDVSGQLVSYTDEREPRLLPIDSFSPAMLKGAPSFDKPAEGASARLEAAPVGGTP